MVSMKLKKIQLVRVHHSIVDGKPVNEARPAKPYLEWKGPAATYRAPDTEAGRAILRRRGWKP